VGGTPLGDWVLVTGCLETGCSIMDYLPDLATVLQKADQRAAVDELRALDEGDARSAVPSPVTLRPTGDGALITREGQEAAKAHIDAIVVAAAAAPARAHTGPVKILDPRHVPTLRALPAVPAAPPSVAEKAAPASTAAPSSTSGASKSTRRRRTGSREAPGARRWLAVLASAALLAAAVFYWMRGVKETPGSASGDSATATVATSMTSAPGATGADAAPAMTQTAATSTAPSATGTAQSANVPGTSSAGAAPSGKMLSPRTSADPYLDAGALPKPPASVEPTSAPVVTAVPSVIPSSAPAGRDPLQPVIKF